MLLYAYAENVVLFYLGGIFLGVGMSWTTTTMVGNVVNKWCKENRGTVMGAVLAANGLGGALAAQIVTPIIYQEGNAFGYRSAYKLVACILLVVGALAMIYGVISSLALPLETIMLPIFANDFFGDKSYNKMLGIFVSVNTAGYALGGPLMNLVCDLCGSYRPMFIACALLMAAITIVSQFAITSFHRRRDEIIKENVSE